MTYYRNGFAYLSGSYVKTLNPANYPDAPSGIQLDASGSVYPGTTTSLANGSAFYSNTSTASGLRIFNYGTATGALGTGSTSTTENANPGGDGVFLDGPGQTFINGSYFPDTYPNLSAKLYGGQGGFDANNTGITGGGPNLSGNGGSGADIRNGGTLDNLANGHIYAGAAGNNGGPQSGIGVSLDGGTINNAGSITSIVTSTQPQPSGLSGLTTISGAGVYIVGQGDSGTTANYLHNQAGGTITAGTEAAGVQIAAYAGLSGGNYGEVNNAGSITGGQYGADSIGLAISGTGRAGVQIGNQSSVTRGSPELYNTGSITGGKGSGAGIDLGNYGYVFNKGGTITGGVDFVIPGDSNVPGGDGANLGTGALLKVDGGEISAGATIGTPSPGLDDVGVLLNGATLELYGGATISGSNGGGTAIDAIDGSTVDIAPGTVLDGVAFGQFGDNILNLTGSSGQSGTIAYGLGTQIYDFGGLTFDGAATWTVDMTSNDLSSPSGPQFSSFGHTDTIDVTDFNFNGGDITKSFSGGELELSNGTTSIYLGFPGFTNADQFTVTANGSGGTDINTPCYRSGTRIRTVAGDVPIEKLAVGDQVMTLSGAVRPIRWIGRRSYSKNHTAGNRNVLPIRIRANALGEGMPRRDLWVSPEHAMWVQGVLIPARALVNGVSILQEETSEDVTYLHLEFDTHEVIYAEGALGESFVDDESRLMFDNVAEYFALYPNAQPVPARFCAPRVEEGEELEARRRRLNRVLAPQSSGPLREARCVIEAVPV